LALLPDRCPFELARTGNALDNRVLRTKGRVTLGAQYLAAAVLSGSAAGCCGRALPG